MLWHSLGSKSGQITPKAGHIIGLKAVSGAFILPSRSLGGVGHLRYHVPPFQVYDTPPMAVKGPNGQDPGQEIYDVPPSVEKNLHQTVSAAGKLSASPYNKKTHFTVKTIIH